MLLNLPSAFWEFQTITVSEWCLTKIASVENMNIHEKYVYILAWEMSSPVNQHCANCIGTLSFPISSFQNKSASRAIAQKNYEEKCLFSVDVDAEKKYYDRNCREPAWRYRKSALTSLVRRITCE